MKRIIIILLTFFIGSVAYAADSAESMLASLLKNMHTMQANFTQTTVDNQGRKLQQSSGQVSIQRPNHFRWEILTPNKQLIVTNGKNLWMYEPDLEQVTIRSLVRAAGETPALLLSDENLSLTKEFYIRSIGSLSQQQFALTPKDKSSMISSLLLSFNHNQINGMDLQDHLGHTTKIHFTQIKMNPILSPILFAFKPPAHIDIIDETKH